MNLGISSSCFYPMITEKALEILGKAGIKTTEIFFNAVGELSDSFVKLLKSICDCYGIDVVSIHPTMSFAESFFFFSAYERRTEEALDFFKRYGEICSELGAKYIILHGGKPNGILDDREYFERFMDISEAVGKNGSILLQENVVGYRAGNFEFLKNMSDYLKDDAKFCLDIKQCIRGGYSPFDTLSALKTKVKHIHLSDNNEKNDCLIPSKGTFDFDSFFSLAKKVGFNGTGLIEVYSDAFSAVPELLYSFDFLLNKNT
ncbi:MAG: sugar phosphate isomerase/epimerase [Clostridia bacterium]|nr:sugar phosphate isomerase/epimerase [Clostridia bacterium]